MRAPPPVWARYLNASNWTAPGADIASFTAPLRATTVFDLNVVTSNVSWQVAGLRSFRGQGVPIERVEMGNELWDPVQNQKRWADGAGYLAAMQPYLSAVGAAFPRAQLALVGMGAGSAANAAWNRAVLAAPGSRAAHAATVHFYTPLGIGSSRPVEPSQAAGILATAFEAAAQQQAHADATIPAAMRIWVTEFGHRATSTSWALPSLDGTWLEGLYGGTTLLLLLRIERLDLALPYCLACADPNAPAFTRGPHGLPPPISQPGSDWRLTARGHVFREIFTTARTAQYQGGGATAAPVTMREMAFAPDVPLVAGGRGNTSSLVGWAFVRNVSGAPAATAAVMIHLGNTSTTLDLTGALPRSRDDNWRVTTTWSRDVEALVRNSTAVGALRREFSLLAESRILVVPPFAVVTLVSLATGEASAAHDHAWKTDDEQLAAALVLEDDQTLLLGGLLAAILLSAMSLRGHMQMRRRLAALERLQTEQASSNSMDKLALSETSVPPLRPSTSLTKLRRRATAQTPTIDASAVTYECAFRTNFKYAVTRTVEDKLQKEAVSILDFGAVPNGVTDCTAAIQHAIDFVTVSEEDQIENAFARPLLIPPGTYDSLYN